MNHTKQSTHQDAVALGAVQSLSYILRNKRYSRATGMFSDGEKEVFSRHYFNKEGKETVPEDDMIADNTIVNKFLQVLFSIIKWKQKRK